MKFSNYLKLQLVDFVNVYKLYFRKTVVASLLMALFSCVCMAILFRFSEFDSLSGKRTSILSFFLYRYSFGETYSIVDLSKGFLLFFISLFSIGFLRFEASIKSEEGGKPVPFNLKINLFDILYFLVILFVCSALDYGIFSIRTIIISFNSPDVEKWIYAVLFQLRIYLPLVLFSFALYYRYTNTHSDFSLKKLLLLFVTLWLFNEFAYEFVQFVRIHIIGLFTIPVEANTSFIVESILGIPVLALLFLGYHSAMCTSLNLLNTKDSREELIK